MTATEANLEDRILEAAGVTRGRAGSSTTLETVSAMLLLKWASDGPGRLDVPRPARWTYLTEQVDRSPDGALRRALDALIAENHELLDGLQQDVDLAPRLGPTEAAQLIRQFDRVDLSDAALIFEDTLGRAYDTVIERLAPTSRRKNETQRASHPSIRLMIELAGPRPGHSFHDPFAESATTLTEALGYVRERNGEDTTLRLHGQEWSRSAWNLGRLRLLFHEAGGTRLELGGDAGGQETFDRVATVLPHSTGPDVVVPEHARYDRELPRIKKPEMTYLQHVLATLSPDGVGVVAAPHGLLFRSGPEATIRQRIVEDHRIDAVIGIGPTLFEGANVPACILVLAGTTGRARQSKDILFVNAEPEIATGRTSAHLEARHIEKITSVFRYRLEVTGFSRRVPLDEIAANSFDLNIGRYVGRTSPADVHLDPRALLSGRVPQREVDPWISRFHAFGIGPCPELWHRDGDDIVLPEDYQLIARWMRESPGLSEQKYIADAERWWQETGALRIEAAVGSGHLLPARQSLLESFRDALGEAEILDEHQRAGVFADWWQHWYRTIRHLDRGAMPAGEPARLLTEMGDELVVRVRRLVVGERQALIELYLSWGDHYAASLPELEQRIATGMAALMARLEDLNLIRPDTGVADTSDRPF